MLTENQCRSAKPKNKAFKLHDAGGLFLIVLPSGTKSWRQKYSFGGKEKQLTHGIYPKVSLKEARKKRDAAKADLDRNLDPQAVKRQAQARRYGRAEGTNTFREAAKRWHKLQSSGWKDQHAQTVMRRLEMNLFPVLGDRDVSALVARDFRPILEQVQTQRSVELAHQLLNYTARIYDLAIVDERAQSNPTVGLGPLLLPITRHKLPAILNLKEARAALKAFEAERHWPAIKLASRLLALTAARPGPIRFAQIEEFRDLDGDEPTWTIPAKKMKLKKAEAEQQNMSFTIPLVPAAVDVVKAAIEVSNGRPYLFPQERFGKKPISENALNIAYRRSPLFSGRHVPHGWRSSFSTIMNERAADLDRPGDRAVIDLMLAHKPIGVESRYNRAAYMPRRRLIAQEWADLLMVGQVPAQQLCEGPVR